MAQLIVRPYTANDRHQWDAFVEASNNGTMFHLQRFLDYHPEDKWQWHHLMVFDAQHLVAVIPGGINARGEFWSPTGASYGGVVTADISFEKSLAIVDAFRHYCTSHDIKHAFLIPPPLIYTLNYSQHVEYAMLYRKADFELHYISHAIELKRGENFLDSFDQTARKSIRKIVRERKITICDSDDYQTFHRILTENKAKHGARATHTLDDLLRLRELVPDKLKLMMVYHGAEPIAGSLLFLANRKVVLCFYNMLRYEFEHLRPIYLVMHETVRWAMDNGYEWVDIGVSQDTKDANPMTPSLGLIAFKERFDARGILRSTYHLTMP